MSYKVRVFNKCVKWELVGHDNFYFFDTGVFQALRRRGTFDQSGEIEGQALEGLVAQHLRAWNSYGENEHEITYWRTRWGVEVDFVVYGPSGIWALEVKSSDRVKSEDLRGVNAFLDDYPEAKGILLYRGTARLKEGRIHCLPVENFLRGLTPQKELV